ncbi:MAG TPA: hypothetical protein VH252_01695 [Chthoniobacterales bacterium]|nr:hypothetical protein [Chthoniobacterales bacterium]
MKQPRSPRFYFALPRLLARLRGGDAGRAEQNSFEAWSANLAIYLISYLYFAGYIPEIPNWGLRALILVALAFLVWFFWLLALYLNSLILKFGANLGLLRSFPTRRGQAVLIVMTATAMAFALVERGSFAGEIGALWLVATAMNLVAALILAFTNGEPARQQ